jgi:hypothetical protein
MESVTSTTLINFLQRLGDRYIAPIEFYLLGGSALCLLGSPRETLDVDYTVELSPNQLQAFQSVLEQLGKEMKLALEEVPLGEFIPLPPEALQRRRFVGQFRNLDVYIFDLYSIALSKIARGFEADIEDALFMLAKKLIAFDELERLYQIILPDVATVDINPKEFQSYFEEVRRRWMK